MRYVGHECNHFVLSKFPFPVDTARRPQKCCWHWAKERLQRRGYEGGPQNRVWHRAWGLLSHLYHWIPYTLIHVSSLLNFHYESDGSTRASPYPWIEGRNDLLVWASTPSSQQRRLQQEKDPCTVNLHIEPVLCCQVHWQGASTLLAASSPPRHVVQITLLVNLGVMLLQPSPRKWFIDTRFADALANRDPSSSRAAQERFLTSIPLLSLYNNSQLPCHHVIDPGFPIL